MKNMTTITFTQDARKYGSNWVTENTFTHIYQYSRQPITYRGAARILKREGIEFRSVSRLQHNLLS